MGLGVKAHPPTLPTERQTQRAILKMLARCFPHVIVHHSPNGAHLAGSDVARSKQMGALLGDGMLKGFPDILLLWPHGKGALVEVKRPKLGKLSDVQTALHARLEAIGWPVATVTTEGEVYALLRQAGAPWNGKPL